MGEATQGLLKELADAMTRMPNDPQGVAGWLLSNYRFQKMGTGEPVEKFHRKGGGPGAIDESQLKVDPTYNEFIKRNNAGSLVARGEQLAKIKHSGNGAIAEFASMIQSVGDPYGDDTVSTLQPDPVLPQAEAQKEYMEEQKAYLELKAAGFDPFAKNLVGGITDLSQAINPQDVVNLMNQKAGAPLKEEVMLSQTEEGRRYLQRDLFKKLKAQDAISGGGGGAFRR